MKIKKATTKKSPVPSFKTTAAKSLINATKILVKAGGSDWRKTIGGLADMAFEMGMLEVQVDNPCCREALEENLNRRHRLAELMQEFLLDVGAHSEFGLHLDAIQGECCDALWDLEYQKLASSRRALAQAKESPSQLVH